MRILKRNTNPKNLEKINQNDSSHLKSEEKVDIRLSDTVAENLEKFKAFLEESSDSVLREFKLGSQGLPCALVYIDGLVNASVVSENIMKALMYEITMLEQASGKIINLDNAYDYVKEHAVSVGEITETSTLDKCMLKVMSGEVALIVEGSDKILIVNARGWAARGISKPDTEGTIRGPKDAFTEGLRVNTALLRRKCKDPNMVIKTLQLGRRSKTDVSYIYIKGITNPELIKEVEKRLAQIDVDEIIETGQIEQWIQDSYLSPFPQVQISERPDVTISNIIEGRVAILVDNSPFSIIVPTGLYQLMQSPEDYYDKWIIGSFLRTIRWAASLLAAFIPSLYIAVITYNPGFIPTPLALAIAANRTNIPFPAFIEVLLMELTIELLRESGARLPNAIGQTIGIVGGIVIGDAAVRAGITSPSMVLLVSITAIASFVIPTYSAAIGLRLIRFPLMILAATLGLYGVALGFIAVNIHLVNLKSFGFDYMTPQAPFITLDTKDWILRLPQHLLRSRPISIHPIDIDRMGQDSYKERKNA
ncbi:MAG: spore germination protein [Clostridiales bacterium]|nr:spore germination protein [Clostridiales bacterium]